MATEGRISTLTIAPSAVSLTGSEFDSLQPQLVLGLQDEFLSVGDVAALPDGAFVVLDRAGTQMIFFDSTGRATNRFGSKGNGPGEFMSPLAIASLGSTLIVWQTGKGASFHAFDLHGRSLESRVSPQSVLQLPRAGRSRKQ